MPHTQAFMPRAGHIPTPSAGPHAVEPRDRNDGVAFGRIMGPGPYPGPTFGPSPALQKLASSRSMGAHRGAAAGLSQHSHDDALLLSSSGTSINSSTVGVNPGAGPRTTLAQYQRAAAAAAAVTAPGSAGSVQPHPGHGHGHSSQAFTLAPGDPHVTHIRPASALTATNSSAAAASAVGISRLAGGAGNATRASDPGGSRPQSALRGSHLALSRLQQNTSASGPIPGHGQGYSLARTGSAGSSNGGPLPQGRHSLPSAGNGNRCGNGIVAVSSARGSSLLGAGATHRGGVGSPTSPTSPLRQASDATAAAASAGTSGPCSERDSPGSSASHALVFGAPTVLGQADVYDRGGGDGGGGSRRGRLWAWLCFRSRPRDRYDGYQGQDDLAVVAMERKEALQQQKTGSSKRLSKALSDTFMLRNHRADTRGGGGTGGGGGHLSMAPLRAPGGLMSRSGRKLQPALSLQPQKSILKSSSLRRAKSGKEPIFVNVAGARSPAILPPALDATGGADGMPEAGEAHPAPEGGAEAGLEGTGAFEERRSGLASRAAALALRVAASGPPRQGGELAVSPSGQVHWDSSGMVGFPASAAAAEQGPGGAGQGELLEVGGGGAGQELYGVASDGAGGGDSAAAAGGLPTGWPAQPAESGLSGGFAGAAGGAGGSGALPPSEALSSSHLAVSTPISPKAGRCLAGHGAGARAGAASAGMGWFSDSPGRGSASGSPAKGFDPTRGFLPKSSSMQHQPPSRQLAVVTQNALQLDGASTGASSGGSPHGGRSVAISAAGGEGGRLSLVHRRGAAPLGRAASRNAVLPLPAGPPQGGGAVDDTGSGRLTGSMESLPPAPPPLLRAILSLHRAAAAEATTATEVSDDEEPLGDRVQQMLSPTKRPPAGFGAYEGGGRGSNPVCFHLERRTAPPGKLRGVIAGLAAVEPSAGAAGRARRLTAGGFLSPSSAAEDKLEVLDVSPAKRSNGAANLQGVGSESSRWRLHVAKAIREHTDLTYVPLAARPTPPPPLDVASEVDGAGPPWRRVRGSDGVSADRMEPLLRVRSMGEADDAEDAAEKDCEDVVVVSDSPGPNTFPEMPDGPVAGGGAAAAARSVSNTPSDLGALAPPEAAKQRTWLTVSGVPVGGCGGAAAVNVAAARSRSEWPYDDGRGDMAFLDEAAQDAVVRVQTPSASSLEDYMTRTAHSLGATAGLNSAGDCGEEEDELEDEDGEGGENGRGRRRRRSDSSGSSVECWQQLDTRQARQMVATELLRMRSMGVEPGVLVEALQAESTNAAARGAASNEHRQQQLAMLEEWSPQRQQLQLHVLRAQQGRSTRWQEPTALSLGPPPLQQQRQQLAAADVEDVLPGAAMINAQPAQQQWRHRHSEPVFLGQDLPGGIGPTENAGDNPQTEHRHPHAFGAAAAASPTGAAAQAAVQAPPNAFLSAASIEANAADAPDAAADVTPAARFRLTKFYSISGAAPGHVPGFGAQPFRRPSPAVGLPLTAAMLRVSAEALLQNARRVSAAGAATRNPSPRQSITPRSTLECWVQNHSLQCAGDRAAPLDPLDELLAVTGFGAAPLGSTADRDPALRASAAAAVEAGKPAVVAANEPPPAAMPFWRTGSNRAARWTPEPEVLQQWLHRNGGAEGGPLPEEERKGARVTRQSLAANMRLAGSAVAVATSNHEGR